jgi:4a-hydroxytetrahydrobiopterin dehydratase
MVIQVIESLANKHCRPCEGGVARYTTLEAEAKLEMLSGWQLNQDGLRIEKFWVVKDFVAGIDFLNRVATLAEREGHHPELHLTGYRHVWIELWTHAIDGLSENDFIMAAKIDQLPIELKEPPI